MKKGIWKTIREFLFCLLAVLCLAAAGSDGDYFPWVNVIGTLILVIMAMVYLRNTQRSDILSRTEQRSALDNVRDINARIGRLTEGRIEANRILKSRGTAVSGS